MLRRKKSTGKIKGKKPARSPAERLAGIESTIRRIEQQFLRPGRTMAETEREMLNKLYEERKRLRGY